MWTASRTPFLVTLGNRDIFKCPTLSSGVRIGNIELDYAFAAQWWGFNSLEEMQESLSLETQAHNVAVYRTKNQIEGALAYRQYRRSKRANKPKNGR